MNQNVVDRVEKLAEKHENVIAIFGGAPHVTDLESLVAQLHHVVKSAKYFKWHAGDVDACRTFCTLCGYDPALVEAYIGMRFKELVCLCSYV